tara:strand:- start:33 stop:230 length:198 start_codon:yes stop_codon:yes gene_type:complete
MTGFVSKYLNHRRADLFEEVRRNKVQGFPTSMILFDTAYCIKGRIKRDRILSGFTGVLQENLRRD